MKSIHPVFGYVLLGLAVAGPAAAGFFGGFGDQVPCGKLFFLLPSGFGLLYFAAFVALFRQVESREEGLFSKNGKKVAYRDIKWIGDYTSNRGGFVCISFFDLAHQRTRLLAFIPRKFDELGESPMTQFIRARMERDNPGGSAKGAEPSKWKVFGILLLPMLLTALGLKLFCPEFLG